MSVYARRVASIDVFRGLTMLVMIFVNDAAGVRNLPWWTYHMPGRVSGMTYVDVVFPAFLFALGLSLPLAVSSRLAKGNSSAQIWGHAVVRSLSLALLGLGLANVEKGNPASMRISNNAWGLLFLLAAILVWYVYPSRRSSWLRILGVVGLVILLAIFRRSTANGPVQWLDFSYWEILGLIGWTYLAVCVLYLPTLRWRWAPTVWFLVLIVLNVCSAARWIGFADRLPLYLWPFGNGALAMIAMAGVLTTQLLFSGEDRSALTLNIRVCGFGSALALMGWLLVPLGVSKNNATPSWALFSSGIAVILFAGLHWICDVKQRVRWAGFSRAAGANTLLTYLLPDLFYFGIGMRWLPLTYQSGWPGAMRSVLFTACILLVSTALTRMHVRLHL